VVRPLSRVLPCIFMACCVCVAAAAGPLFTEGLDALRRGDFPTAERKLKAELQSQPNEVEALSFLGVALDNQKKFAEADAVHHRALALAPRSNSILDKYASHLLTTGDVPGARKTFLRALALDPADGYANLELARLALKEKNGPEALSYLNRLSAEQQSKPDVAVDRLVALELSGRYTEANSLATTFRNDANWNAAAGRALAEAGELTRAEALLEDALTAHPDNFPLLYNLGVMASQASHYTRSREVLEAAVRLEPQNVDAIYSLAYALDALKQPDAAFRLLAEAAQLAPGRADIQKSFAIAAANLSEYKDAAAAWNRYMQLEPADDTGRRERGFARAHIGQLDAGLADLRWYIARHPDDADAYFELGVAAGSLSSLDKAVELRPDFAVARSARGALYYREGKPEAALPDLERAAATEPGSAMIQYRLGQVYLALDRLNDAIRHFRRAAELAPDDYPAQFHLANALAEAGQTAESDAIMERIRKWPVRKNPLTPDLLN
jgi:tetratricopeptide (TPR) repeat protein